MLLVGNGETRWRVNRVAVDGLDVECQDLSSFRLVVAVKTGSRPFEVQMALQKPLILCEVGDSLVGTRARCRVSVPLLGKVQSVQGDVGGATSMVLGVAGEAQDLGGGAVSRGRVVG